MTTNEITSKMVLNKTYFFSGVLFFVAGIVTCLPVSLASVFGNRPLFMPTVFEISPLGAIAIGVVNICIGIIYVGLACRKKVE